MRYYKITKPEVLLAKEKSQRAMLNPRVWVSVSDMEVTGIFRVYFLNYIISAMTNSACIKSQPLSGGGKFIFLRKIYVINKKYLLELSSLID